MAKELQLLELFSLAQAGNRHDFERFVDERFGIQDGWHQMHHPKSGDTVATIAAQFGHLSLLMFCDDTALESSNNDGKRPLHMAAQYGHAACVRYLLDRKVTIDALKRSDWTPLMLACLKGNLEVIRYLVMAGASLFAVNKDGWNCFHIAAREGHPDVINYLLDTQPFVGNTVSRNGRTPLHTAALHGKIAVIQRILDIRNHSDINAADSCGTTPLMDAVRAGNKEVVQLLLKHGANLEMSDKNGRTALHHAAQSANLILIKYLVTDCHVSVNQPTSTSLDSALHIAAKLHEHSLF